MDVLEAVVAGDLEAVRALVASDPSVASARDEQGLSAILQALYRGRDEILAVLLAANPEMDVFDASALGDTGRVAELLDEDYQRVSAWSSDGFTPVHLAVFFGHPKTAELLLRHGADPDVVSRNPMTVRPLHSAVAGRDAEAVAVLVSSGANVNAPSHGGFTPLLEAAQNGDRRIVELLLAAGADPAAVLDGGKTAADLALAHGHHDVAALLRERT